MTRPDSAQMRLMNINGTYTYLYRYLYQNEVYLLTLSTTTYNATNYSYITLHYITLLVLPYTTSSFFLNIETHFFREHVTYKKKKNSLQYKYWFTRHCLLFTKRLCVYVTRRPLTVDGYNYGFLTVDGNDIFEMAAVAKNCNTIFIYLLILL